MKKQLFALAAIGVAVCCLGACKPTEPVFQNPDEYDVLNTMLNANYSHIEITLTETVDEDTSLTSIYSIAYSETEITVEYSVEKFNTIELDKPTTELKTTLTGVAIIVGSFISVMGDDVGIDADIARVGLTFKKAYFENDILSDDSFHADVKNVSGFWGSQVTCSNMKIATNFGEAFNDINIQYLSESGNKVEIKYIFNI